MCRFDSHFSSFIFLPRLFIYFLTVTLYYPVMSQSCPCYLIACPLVVYLELKVAFILSLVVCFYLSAYFFSFFLVPVMPGSPCLARSLTLIVSFLVSCVPILVSDFPKSQISNFRFSTILPLPVLSFLLYLAPLFSALPFDVFLLRPVYAAYSLARNSAHLIADLLCIMLLACHFARILLIDIT